MVPALKAVQDLCKPENGEFIHFGPTTQDVLDTGRALAQAGEAVFAAYRPGRSMGEAFRLLLADLLSNYGLVFFDPLDLELREAASPLLVRALVARDFSEAFEDVDAIVAPVSPFPAFKLGEKVDDPLAMYLSDIYTITGSLAGIPCMSVPCGTTAGGLPVGMQILTRHFDETTMFRLADAFETAQRG